MPDEAEKGTKEKQSFENAFTMNDVYLLFNNILFPVILVFLCALILNRFNCVTNKIK